MVGQSPLQGAPWMAAGWESGACPKTDGRQDPCGPAAQRWLPDARGCGVRPVLMLCGEGPLDPWTPGWALQGPVFKGMPMHAGPLWAGPWQGGTSHPARKQLSGRRASGLRQPRPLRPYRSCRRTEETPVLSRLLVFWCKSNQSLPPPALSFRCDLPAFCLDTCAQAGRVTAQPITDASL